MEHAKSFCRTWQRQERGYRVITFYSGDDIPVFLLNIFAKGEKVNLTKAEQNELRTILADVVAAYRGGVRRYAEYAGPGRHSPLQQESHSRPQRLLVEALSGLAAITEVFASAPREDGLATLVAGNASSI